MQNRGFAFYILLSNTFDLKPTIYLSTTFYYNNVKKYSLPEQDINKLV